MNVFSDFVDITPNIPPSAKGRDLENASPQSSLSEPITETIKRDLNNIYIKIAFFFMSKENTADNIKTEIRNYDLWGPFVFSLFFAFSVTFNQKESMEKVFSTVILYILFGNLILTLNSRLLKTNLSFFQGILNRHKCPWLLDVSIEFGSCVQHDLLFYSFLPQILGYIHCDILVDQVRL